MGSVYLAHDTQLDRQVALKVPQFSDKDGPQLVERFYREARAAATLQHSNLCPVYDVGQIDGIHYLTMAYIEGTALSELVDTGKPLPQRQVAALLRKLALALQEAHARGVIHRDLKPGNIMISKAKEPVIMDFGLARRTSQGEARLTKSGAIIGTPAYMPPEQVKGDVEAMGPRSDIYSLGVILYELVTGRLPFEGPVAAVLGRILVAEPMPPSMLRPDLDPQLDAICLTAMAKKVEDRYATMAELAAALGDYLRVSGRPSSVETASLPSQDTASTLPARTAVREKARSTQLQAPPRQVPRSAWIAAGSAAAILLLGVIIYVATDNGTVKIELSDPGAKGRS